MFLPADLCREFLVLGKQLAAVRRKHGERMVDVR